MEVKNASFVVSSASYKNCPKVIMPEFAFIGRSNVGKSSLINMLCNNKKLAKTSSTPGKTQLINHFLINDTWHLVDLPGYGYAKLSKQTRKAFAPMIEEYLLNREQLFNTFVLIDIRLPPQKIDLDFLQFMGSNALPCSIIFTKSDKVKAGERDKNIHLFNQALKETWEQLPPFFISSSVKKQGKEAVLTYIEEVLSNA